MGTFPDEARPGKALSEYSTCRADPLYSSLGLTHQNITGMWIPLQALPLSLVLWFLIAPCRGNNHWPLQSCHEDEKTGQVPGTEPGSQREPSNSFPFPLPPLSLHTFNYVTLGKCPNFSDFPYLHDENDAYDLEVIVKTDQWVRGPWKLLGCRCQRVSISTKQ